VDSSGPQSNRGPEQDEQVGPSEEPEGPPPRPGWVLGLVAIIAILLIAILVIMLLTGTDHGPGRHNMQERMGLPAVEAAH
jgi:hypothetical protein